jgi:hypothetical protein
VAHQLQIGRHLVLDNLGGETVLYLDPPGLPDALPLHVGQHDFQDEVVIDGGTACGDGDVDFEPEPDPIVRFVLTLQLRMDLGAAFVTGEDEGSEQQAQRDQHRDGLETARHGALAHDYLLGRVDRPPEVEYRPPASTVHPSGVGPRRGGQNIAYEIDLLYYFM